MFRTLFAAALCWSTLLPVALPAHAQVTVFVVRHAEKSSETPDPGLTPAGTARAEVLAHQVGDAGVTRIFTSQFKRTKDTGAPLASRLGIAAEVINAQDTDGLVATLKALPAGTRAVVVSHSNLVPMIVEGLSGQKVGELTEGDYDRIYTVVMPPSGPSIVLYLHFGAPSPSTGGAMR